MESTQRCEHPFTSLLFTLGLYVYSQELKIRHHDIILPLIAHISLLSRPTYCRLNIIHGDIRVNNLLAIFVKFCMIYHDVQARNAIMLCNLKSIIAHSCVSSNSSSNRSSSASLHDMAPYCASSG